MDAEPQITAFADAEADRNWLFGAIPEAISSHPVWENDRYSLSLSNLNYNSPLPYSLKQQKEKLLKDEDLTWKLSGTWSLKNRETGETIAKKRGIIAHVPYITPRGTAIRRGSEYTIARQARLKPGVYARRRSSGELEAHVNPAQGTGRQFRIVLEPSTGKFKLNVGQANIPLVDSLKLMGVSQEQIEASIGKEMYAANSRPDKRTASKLLRHFAGSTGLREANKELLTPEDYRSMFSAMVLDPKVTRRTLKTEYTGVDPAVMLHAARKLLEIQRGESETDDRDSLEFQTVHSAKDFLADKIRKDSSGIMRKLLWKITKNGNLDSIAGAPFDKYIDGVFNSSFASPLEEINPLELADQQQRIVRVGEGGIASSESIPDEARDVQPSQLNFVDIIRGPESSKIGTDTRVAYNTKWDGRHLYAKFLTPSEQEVFLRPEDVAEKTVAFPGEPAEGSSKIRAMRDGKVVFVHPNEVDLVIPSSEAMFSTVSNMVPLLSGVKGQRLLMGSKMQLQALPLPGAEAPLVQSATPEDPNVSFEQKAGKSLGAVRSPARGRVIKVTPDVIVVQGADGIAHRQELHNNFFYNRKTFLHNTPVVAVGDTVDKDTLLARSNFTSEDGTAALGKNLSVAYTVYGGHNYEDAVVLSESAARKLKAEHMYTRSMEFNPSTTFGKNNFVAMYPGAFNAAQLRSINKEGVVLPGTVVHPGDPLLLATGKRQAPGASLIYRPHKLTPKDVSLVWDHNDDGLVTDVVKSKTGWKVVVKSYSPMRVGDKMCFDPATELLTKTGWIPVSKINHRHEVATLSCQNELEYQQPERVWQYNHDGYMYSLRSPHIDMLVTPRHKLWVSSGAGYSAVSAYNVLQSEQEYEFSHFFDWRPPARPCLPLKIHSAKGAGSIPTERWLEFIGYFISTGSVLPPPITTKSGGSPGHEFSSSKGGVISTSNKVVLSIPETRLGLIRRVCLLLGLVGIRYKIRGSQFIIHNKKVETVLALMAKASRLPNYLHEAPAPHIRIFLDAVIRGVSGSRLSKTIVLRSSALADELQILGLKVGWRITSRRAKKEDFWVCRINRAPKNPSRTFRKSKKVQEQLIKYNGPVYCVSVPNEIVMCRRNGLPHWSHNSGRFGDKGVVSKIVPDDQMLRDSEGNIIDVVLNPLGIISRVNPSQAVEAALGKIAYKTGKPYKVPGFTKGNLAEGAAQELKKHGLSDTEDLYDPVRGAKIKQVFTGRRFLMRLHHSAEGKASGRSVAGENDVTYTSDRMPARGGSTGAKRLSVQDINALMSHGATNIIRDAHNITGRRNDDYWRALRLGYTLPTPGRGFVHDKFQALLRGAGINMKKSADATNVMALTRQDIDSLTNGDVVNGGTVDPKSLDPHPGGLFDLKLTGGADGKGWSTIKLAEPMPSPAMERPIRELLDLTQREFEEVLGGKKTYHDLRGPKAIEEALKGYNIGREILNAEAEIKSGRKTRRDKAIKKLGYLTMFQKTGIKPADLMWDRVPVLPPAFRPIVPINDKTRISADANELYRDVFNSNEALSGLVGQISDEDLAEDRMAVYNSIKAVVGLGDPIGAKTKERKLKGLLKQVFGSSPKHGIVQRKLISVPQDMTGRAVITPDPSLDMDEVGLPEEKAWDIYAPFIMRRLVRAGAPAVSASTMVESKSPEARKALLEELEARPVLVNRAPVLHKFSIQALKPKLSAGDTLRLPPVLTAGYGADFDGDTMQYFVPVTDKAVQDAVKMLPSNNLIDSVRFKPHFKPRQEFVFGLWKATKSGRKGTPRVFRSAKDAIQAYKSGKIGPNDTVQFER